MGDDRLPSSAISGTRVGKYLLGRFVTKNHSSKMIRMAIDTKSHQLVAIKIQEKEWIERTNLGYSVRREINILGNLRHPSVVRLLHVFNSPTHVFMAMEAVEGKPLHAEIQRFGRLHEDRSRQLFKQLMAAVEYMHSKRVAHQDIRVEKLLLTKDGKQIKLVGFRRAVWTDGERSGEDCGQRRRKKPASEKERGKLSYRQNYRRDLGKAASTRPKTANTSPPDALTDARGGDIRCAGVVLLAMTTGQLPPETERVDGVESQDRHALKPTFPQHLSRDLADLLRVMLPEGPSKRPSVAMIISHIWMLPSRGRERSNRPKDRRPVRFPSFLTDTSDDAGGGFGPEGFTTHKWHTSPGIVGEDATATAAMEAIKTARLARKSAERAASEAREAENTAKLALAAALDEVALKAPLTQRADARGPSSLSSLEPKPRRKLQEAGPPGDSAHPPFHGGNFGGGKGAEGNGQLSPPPDKADFSRSRSSHSRRWHGEKKSAEGGGMKSAAPRSQQALMEWSDGATAMSAERKDEAAKHVSAKKILSPLSDMSISSSVTPWHPMDVSSSRGCADKMVSVVRQSVRFRSPPVVPPTTSYSRRASSVSRGANRPAWGGGAKIARVSKESAHGAKFEPWTTVAKSSLPSVEQSTVTGAAGIASVPLQVFATVTTSRPVPSRPILIAPSPIRVASAESKVKGSFTYSKAWSSSPGRLSAHSSSILKAARQRGASSAGRGIAFDINIPSATTRKPAASKAWLADDGGDQQQGDFTTGAATTINNSSASDISVSLSLGNEPRPTPTQPADDSTKVETTAEAESLSSGSSRRRFRALSSSSSIPTEKHAQPMKESSTGMTVTESQTIAMETAEAGGPKGSGRPRDQVTETKAGALHPGGSPEENPSIEEAAKAQTGCLKAPAEPRNECLVRLPEAARRRREAPRAQTNSSAMGLAEGVVQQPPSPGERATEVEITAEPGLSKERVKVGVREQSEVSRTLPGEVTRGALSPKRSGEATTATAVESAAPDLGLLRPTSEHQADQWLESFTPQFSELNVTWDKSSGSPPTTVTRHQGSFTQTQATIEVGGLSRLSAGESQPNLSVMQFESPAGSQAGSTSGESSEICEGPFTGGRETSPQKGKEDKNSPIYSPVSELSAFVVPTTAEEPSPEPRAETVEQSMQTSKSPKVIRASTLKTVAKASEKTSAYASRVQSETGKTAGVSVNNGRKDEATKVLEPSGEKIAVGNEHAGNARGRRGARPTAAAHATQAPPSVSREAEEVDAKDKLVSTEAFKRHVFEKFGVEETEKSAQSEHTAVDAARYSSNIRNLAADESIWVTGAAEVDDNVGGTRHSFSVRDAILVHTERLRGRVERRGRGMEGATPDAGPRSRSLSVPRTTKSRLTGQRAVERVAGEGEEGVAREVVRSLPKRSSATVVDKRDGGDCVSSRPRSRGFTRAVAKIFGKRNKKQGQDREEPHVRVASAV